MSFGDVEVLKLSGKIFWPVVQKPRAFKNGVPMFSLDLEVDEATVDLLLDKGMVKNTKVRVLLEDGSREAIESRSSLWRKMEGRKFITLRREAVTKSGKEVPPLVVVDKDGKPLTDLIGNDSTANVIVELFPREHDGVKFSRVRLAAVQVTELVPYESKGPSLSSEIGDLLGIELPKASAKVESKKSEFDDLDPTGSIT